MRRSWFRSRSDPWNRIRSPSLYFNLGFLTLGGFASDIVSGGGL